MSKENKVRVHLVIGQNKTGKSVAFAHMNKAVADRVAATQFQGKVLQGTVDVEVPVK